MTPEEWAKKKGTAAHELAGARQHNGWVQGEQLTEQQYDDGLAAFLGSPLSVATHIGTHAERKGVRA